MVACPACVPLVAAESPTRICAMSAIPFCSQCGVHGVSALNWYCCGAWSCCGSPWFAPGTTTGTPATKESITIPFSKSNNRALSGHLVMVNKNACCTSMEKLPDPPPRREVGGEFPGTTWPLISRETKNRALADFWRRTSSHFGTVGPSSGAPPAVSTGSTEPCSSWYTTSFTEVDRAPTTARTRSIAVCKSIMCFTAPCFRSRSSAASPDASTDSSLSAFMRCAGDAPPSQSAVPLSISSCSALARAVAALALVSYSTSRPPVSRRLNPRNVSSSCAAKESSRPISGCALNSRRPTRTSKRLLRGSPPPPPPDAIRTSSVASAW
mmetsp:Transcript_10664/g.39469  ORF Transcript_10664/g.39469 Transcript_10664/m.39469 type:complete len:325 (+) Transcript_10664:1015-1989(+)